MGLAEQYNKLHQAGVQKEQLKKNDEAVYKPLIEKLPYRRYIKISAGDDKYSDYYYKTLALELSKDYKSVLEEALPLINETTWRKYDPTLKETVPATCCLLNDVSGRWILIDTIGKYKWSDGSIHIARYTSSFWEDSKYQDALFFRKTRALSELKKRANDVLRLYEPMRFGTQDYLELVYNTHWDGTMYLGSTSFVLFRDGTSFFCTWNQSDSSGDKFPFNNTKDFGDFLVENIYKLNKQERFKPSLPGSHEFI